MNRRLWLQTSLLVPLWAATHAYAEEDDEQVPPPTRPALPAPMAVVAALSTLRQNPQAHADLLRKWLPWFDGHVLRLPGEPGRMTQEGRAAVLEAIAALDACAPLLAHNAHPGLQRAATDHAADQARTGGFGHQGSDGSSPFGRMQKYARVSGLTAENITYGPATPMDIALDLVVDDGVADRGHRRNVLHPRLFLAGAGLAWHPTGRVICVVDYAERLALT